MARSSPLWIVGPRDHSLLTNTGAPRDALGPRQLSEFWSDITHWDIPTYELRIRKFADASERMRSEYQTDMTAHSLAWDWRYQQIIVP